MQDILLAGWSALPAFNGRSRFKAWLFGIAMHKCADFHRAAGRDHLDASVELQDGMSIPSTETLDDWSAEIDRREAVADALAKLPANQREVLEMYYYAELSLPEIAAALDRNLNTVKYQFYRAHTQAAETLSAVPGLAPVERSKHVEPQAAAGLEKPAGAPAAPARAREGVG